MKYGLVKELTVYDRDEYDGETVRVSVEFLIDRVALFKFMDALSPIYSNAPREPILAILDYSKKLGREEAEFGWQKDDTGD